MRHSGLDLGAKPQETRTATLDGWASLDWTGGIDATHLSPLDQLTVTTRNSVYTLIVVSPSSGEVRVRGGTLFPSFTTAHLCGSSLGRGCLKRHVVHPGFCLELSTEELGMIVTTRVRSVTLSSGADGPSSVTVM